MTTEVRNREATRQETYVAPRVNILEHPETVTLEVELPGVPKDGVELEVKDNELTITGRRPDITPEGQMRVQERPRAHFRRVFSLSRAIDQEKVDAHMHNGLLTITLHKTESMKPRRIAIN